MRKGFLSVVLMTLVCLKFIAQTASTLSVIATPNSKEGWIYFKNPSAINPNTVFSAYSAAFNLGNDDQMLFVKDIVDNLGIKHTFYQQHYKGIKLEVGQNAVHSNNGNSYLLTGAICKGLNMNIVPAISSSAAISLAKNYVNSTIYMWEDSLAQINLKIDKNDVNATYYPSPELLITMNGTDLPIIPSNFKLSYKVDIYSKQPNTARAIYIDAFTGAIIKEHSLNYSCLSSNALPPVANSCVSTFANTLYSGNQSIPAFYTANPANGNNLEYKLENPCKGGGVLTKLISVGDVYTTSQTSWGSGPTNAQLTQLHWATNKYYDFLLSTFNRQSIDNNNGQLLSYVNTVGPQFNGIGVDMPVGYGTNDFIGHEWGHGMSKFAVSGTLPNSGEGGSINEGISDIWGTLFEYYLNSGNITNWTIGEDYNAVGFRNLSNPSSKNMPDTYLGNYYSGAGPHEKGQVLGYWFYLLSQGGSGANSSPDPNPLYNHMAYNISGIGLVQSSQILYKAYDYLNFSSNYYDLRNATIQAAIDLYGSNCTASNRVKDAWDAVGVYDYLPPIFGQTGINDCIKACVTKTDVTCVNSIGSANLTIDPSFTGSYTISWFDSNFGIYYGNGLSVNNLPAGNYAVLLNDDNVGCQSYYPFTINNHSLTSLSFSTINSTCMDGRASVIASDGAYPYTYQWKAGTTILTNETSPILENIPAGTYFVTVTDANGCQVTGSTTVSQNAVAFDKPFGYQVTGTEVWNQSLIKIDGVVYVANGGNLTITGNTRVEVTHHPDILDMMPYGLARIVVLPGGNLTVAPTVTLTGCGGTTWDGIELWGTGIFNNLAANGVVNGRVENADIGVLTDRRPRKNQAIVNAYGGKLTTNGAQFVNNKMAIKIPRSNNNYAYNVKLSSFQMDGTSFYKNSFSIPNNEEPIYIYAGENVNLTIPSNNFTGGDASYASDLKGTGIKCIDCILNVNNSAGPVSAFTDLSRGVDAEYIYTTNQTFIDGANFTNNQEAIYLQGSTYGVVKNNTFNVPPPVAPFTKSYGLFTVNSSGFDVNSNTINPTISSNNSYGMVFEESGTVGGEVFKNTFNGVGVGLQAQKNNSNLKIGCNNFNNPNVYSMAIVNMSGFPISSLKWQGKYNLGAKDCSSSSNPAGNEWNYTGCSSGTDKNIFTNNVSFNYETHSNLNTQPICTPNPWFNANVLPYICGISKDPNSCSSIFPLPPAPPTTLYSNYYSAIKDLITIYQNQINSLTPLYKNALASQDGGNTKNLLDAINSNPKKSDGQLKNLLNASGSLSDIVLLALINRNPTVPAGVLKDILANQVPLSFEVLTALENLNLPTGIKNSIYSAQSNTPIYTKADALLGTIKYLQGDIILLQSLLQRTKLQETNSISKEELKTYTDASSKMILAQNYATYNQTDSTRLILSQLSNDTTIIVSEKQNFITYMNSMVNMLDSNRTVYTVDSLIIGSITPISMSNTKVSAHANAALKERKKPYHQYFIADIPANTNQRMANENTDENTEENKQMANTGNFSLYPNPNKGSFKIELKNLNDEEVLTTVTVSNLLGQTILTKTVNANARIIDIQDERLFAGVYIVTLSKENKTIGQSKIIID